jgi:hypothetical protein
MKKTYFFDTSPIQRKSILSIYETFFAQICLKAVIIILLLKIQDFYN